MSRFGQKSPVLVTKEKQGFVLIDGYLRLQAVRIIGMDVVRADIREESEADMLAMVLNKSQERQWESVEQGFLIRDLTNRFEWSILDSQTYITMNSLNRLFIKLFANGGSLNARYV
ncbi:hypothetical protein [Desulfonatronum parangueonense]